MKDWVYQHTTKSWLGDQWITSNGNNEAYIDAKEMNNNSFSSAITGGNQTFMNIYWPQS